MKPSWKDAPPWANWLAQDEDGEWTWFEEKPVIKRAMDHWNSDSGKYVMAIISENNWRKTLERRPE